MAFEIWMIIFLRNEIYYIQYREFNFWFSYQSDEINSETEDGFILFRFFGYPLINPWNWIYCLLCRLVFRSFHLDSNSTGREVEAKGVTDISIVEKFGYKDSSEDVDIHEIEKVFGTDKYLIAINLSTLISPFSCFRR